MVHALQEAWRVLRYQSTLIDLRPAIEHARVGLIRSGRFTAQWATGESLDNYRAASQSLIKVKASKLFRVRSSSRFSCSTIFPSLDHLKDWLYEMYPTESTGSADTLLKQIKEANKQPELKGKIVARVPFMLKVLVKRTLSP